MARKKTSDPRPVRTSVSKTLVKDIDDHICYMPVRDISDFLIGKLREYELSDEEIATARINLNCHGYDGADIQLTASVSETEEEFNKRLGAWNKRQRANIEAKKAEDKASRGKDEAEFEQHGTFHSFLPSTTKKLRSAEAAILNAFVNPR